MSTLGVFPVLPTSFLSPPFPHSSSCHLPGTRPCVDTHAGHRALTVWKERVFGLCSGMWYVSPLTVESPCCTVLGIQ